MIDYVLRRAFEEHQEITIIYQSDNKITERKIKINKINSEYIEAYCFMRHQIRHFKRNRILSAMYMN